MWKFVLKRLVSIIPTLIGATFIVFAIMSLAPGDITDSLMPDASPADKEAYRESIGLNDPMLVQYGRFLINLCKGDLGISYRSMDTVMNELSQRVPYTVQLALAASLITVLIAIPLGMLAAIKQNSVFDSVSMALCLTGVSMPAFWVGILLILLFCVKLNILPASGSGDLTYLILPALTQSVAGLAAIARVTRSSMLEVIRQDYIRTARAKGLPEGVVIRGHAMKNAMLPTVTAAGLQIGNLLCGGVITETVFAWPGIGRFLVSSIGWRDTPAVLGCVVFFVIAVSIVNMLVDVLYGFIDPRVKAIYKKS